MTPAPHDTLGTLDELRAILEQDLALEPERVSDPDEDLLPSDSSRIFDHAGRVYVLHVSPHRFTVVRGTDQTIVAVGSVDDEDATIEHLADEARELAFGYRLIELLGEQLSGTTEREPTPAMAPERLAVPPRPAPAPEVSLLEQAQQMLAVLHQALGAGRSARDGVKADRLEEALEDLRPLRKFAAQLVEQIEALDTALAARVHHECVQCSEPQAPGHLLCPSCLSQSLTDRAVQSALVIQRSESHRGEPLHSTSPTWTPWRRS